MTARDRLLALLDEPAGRAADGRWLDLAGEPAEPARPGRIQALWQSAAGAFGYAGVLDVGDTVQGYVPGALGGAEVRAFYEVDRRLALRPGQTVLDLACGPGTLTRRLARAVGPQGLVVGADLSVPMLERAARALPADTVALARMDAARLPLRDDTVDAVCCSLCLQLVPDPDVVLDEITRVLRPGGRVALAVPAHLPGMLRPVTESMEALAQARLVEEGDLPAALAVRGYQQVREHGPTGITLVDAVLGSSGSGDAGPGSPARGNAAPGDAGPGNGAAGS